MKVYGSMWITGGKQRRCIFAGTQKQLADRIHSNVSSVRNWWTPTGNKEELQVALSKPGVLFCLNSETRKYEEVT